MSIKKSLSLALRKYKAANQLSMAGLASELGIAVSSLQGYIDGTANPCIETIEIIAEKTHIPVTEMVSGTAPGWAQAEITVRAAKEISDLPADRQALGIQLFLQLVALFAGDT